jgi:hypothetical protein
MRGFALQAVLPELAADAPDVRLFDVGQADGFDQLRNPNQPRRMSARQCTTPMYSSWWHHGCDCSLMLS